MPTEIEAKMAVRDPQAVRACIESLAGRPIAEMVQRDSFFDDANGRLKAGDCALRLRCQIIEGETPRLFVTYKGPQQQGQVKRREEIEFAIDNDPAVTSLFERLGYAPKFTYEKRRIRWKHDSCMIELDHIPYLGWFIEIEGPDETTVMRIREQLGLADQALLTTSYVCMLEKHLVGHGITATHVTHDSDGA